MWIVLWIVLGLLAVVGAAGAGYWWGRFLSRYEAEDAWLEGCRIGEQLLTGRLADESRQKYGKQKRRGKHLPTPLSEQPS